MGMVLVRRPLTKEETVVHRRREFRDWLETHVQAYKKWEEKHWRKAEGSQAVLQHMVVVLEPDHPRYMQMGLWQANDWRESDEWYVQFVDGRSENFGGYGGRNAGGVSADKLELIYVPILTAADGAFLEWVYPGVRTLLTKALEPRR